MYKYKNGKEMQYFIYMNFVLFNTFVKKNGETCNKAVMRFPKVQRGQCLFPTINWTYVLRWY